jgi:hypothetical protein
LSRFDFMLDEAPHADHYRKLSPEPITIIESWGLGFHLGNALKYIARSQYKGTEKQDLEKAVFYLQRKINELAI